MLSPGPLDRPKSFGSCPTATKIASPKMKPSITGRDRNWVMKPSRNSPETTKSTPVSTARPAASAPYSAAFAGCSALTVEYTSTAVAEVPATTSCLLVPNTAYSTRDASSVYSPACGGRPARPA
jgi:hypothetical protein